MLSRLSLRFEMLARLSQPLEDQTLRLTYVKDGTFQART